MTKQLTDKEIIDRLKGDTSTRNAIMYYLCTDADFRNAAFDVILGLLIEKDQATYIFHESLIILLKNVRKKTFKRQSNIRTYTIGICKNLCLRRNEKTKKRKLSSLEIDLADNIKDKDNPEKLLIDQEQEQITAQIHRFIYKNLPDNCRKILRARYQKGKKREEIALEMGWSKKDTVSTSLNRCIKKIRHLIKNNKNAQLIIKGRIG